MTSPVKHLIDLLDLKAESPNRFLGSSSDLGYPQLFGGHVVAQALIAVRRTIAQDMTPHSLHAYFLHPGEQDQDITYAVTNLKTGKTFATSQVTASQKSKPIFTMQASFHGIERGPDHQSTTFASLPSPDGLLSELEYTRRGQSKIPEARRSQLTADRAIEIRVIDRVDPFAPEAKKPIRRAWFRTTEPLPNDPIIHQAFLAYSSDFGISQAALLPHALSIVMPQVKVASLDHAIWFHRPTSLNQWLLYEIKSPLATSARGFATGRIYTQEGALVASVAQETLIRVQT